MNYNFMKDLAKKYWQEHLNKGDLAIDATCGNGHDTLFLSKLCTVIGLDIQTQAIQNTEALLESHGVTAVLERIDHQNIDSIPLPLAPRLIVYNLGYLPGGDKSVTTLTKTTLISLEKALHLLADDGAISIVCYPGHEEGKLEEEELLKWASSLPKEKWAVCYHKSLNRSNAPSVIWISSHKKLSTKPASSQKAFEK